jgi:hypothetical protein
MERVDEQRPDRGEEITHDEPDADVRPAPADPKDPPADAGEPLNPA